MNGNVLTAQLRNKQGTWTMSSVVVVPNATYSNINGQFVQDPMPLPRGSWINSAQNYSMNRNVLTAQLKNEQGTWNMSSIVVVPNATYSNNNGQFVQDPMP